MKIISKKINDLTIKTEECVIPLGSILNKDNNDYNINRITSIEDINIESFNEIVRKDSRFIELPGYLVLKKNLEKIKMKIRHEMTVEEIYRIFNEMNIPEDLLSYKKIGYFINTILTGLGYTCTIKGRKNNYIKYGPTRCIINEKK